MVQWIIDGINGWLQSMADALLKPVLDGVAELLFQTPAFDGMPEIQQTWGTVRDVTDALLVILFLVAGILIMASGAMDSHYTVKVMLPRMALAAVASNVSLTLCGMLIQLNNGLIVGILGPNPAQNTWSQLTGGLQHSNLGDALVAALVALAAAAIALVLIVVYLVRAAALLVTVVLAPLAIACYTLPPIEEVATLWVRVFLCALFIQVVEAVLMSLGVQLVNHSNWLGARSGLVHVLLVVAVLYLMVRLPFAAYRYAGNRPPMMRMAINLWGNSRAGLWLRS